MRDGGGRPAVEHHRAGVDAVLHPAELAEIPHRGRALAELLLRNEVRAAPHTSLNGPIGKQRRFAVADARLEDLKAIKRALGGTVNDVALAATRPRTAANSSPRSLRKAMGSTMSRSDGGPAATSFAAHFAAMSVPSSDGSRLTSGDSCSCCHTFWAWDG